LFYFSFIFVLLENHVSLSRGVQVAGAIRRAATRIVVGVGDLVQRSGTRWLGDREVGWPRVWSAPCKWRRGAWVSWLSFKAKVDGLSVV
jgi:hypothetical protein